MSTAPIDGAASAANSGMRAAFSGKLRELQNQLLDLSRRNRLLNFRGDRGAANLRIVDERSPEVFRILAVEGRTMQFLSREEAPREIADVLAGDGDDEGSIGVPLAPFEGAVTADRHRDKYLQTTLPGETLQTRLTRLAQQARSSLEEQGSNILYLVLGTVAWRETPSSDVVSNAPLLLVPVELERKSVNSRYSVRPFDDDIVVNPCLIELAKRQFNANVPLPDLLDDFDLGAYFRSVADAVTPLGWRVEDQIHVGLFSFSKLLMYRDLQPDSWPEGSAIVDHPLVQQLLGADASDSHAPVQAREASELDEAFHPIEVFQVMDADSSQQVAIVAARDGASAVIEGPPGTGKSQTITNVIAECLAQGRRVLFVAEKAAALDVVKGRLAEVGLGDFVLELHSRKTSKAAVLAEVQRCLMRQDDEVASPDVDPEDLARLRARANAYVRELHVARPPLDLSVYEAISRSRRAANAPRPDFSIADVRAWSRSMLVDAREQITSLDARLRRIDDPRSHPWRAVGLTRLGLESKEVIRRQLRDVRAALAAVRASAASLAAWLGRVEPCTVADVEGAIVLGNTLGQSPPGVEPDTWNDSRWSSSEIDSLLTDGPTHAALRPQWQEVFSRDADAEEWGAVLDRRRAGPGLFRWLGSAWRRDTRRLRDACPTALPSRKALLDALTALAGSWTLRSRIDKGGQQLCDLLGTFWRGLDTDWSAVAKIAAGARHVNRLQKEGQLEGAAIGRCLANRQGLRQATAATADALGDFREKWAAWTTATDSSEPAWTGTPTLRDGRLDVLGGALERADSAFSELDDWVSYQAIWKQLAAGPLRAAAQWVVSPSARGARGDLAGIVEQRIYELWLATIIDESPVLSEFHGEEHMTAVERFRDLDRLWIEATRTRVADALRANRPELTGSSRRGSKVAIVEAEVRKKRRHMPLRRLFQEAGDVVQAIKPCFMMSPISVAQYLAPGGPMFDVVIFDEASQVEPADAFGAIARGRQLLLVGDEKQLPPTSFFKKLELDTPISDRDDETGDDFGKDLESILGLGTVRLPHRFSLRWHYRSRHESLISFSNETFYDGLLRIFPSAHTDRQDKGLQMRFVGGRYLRGGGRINTDEVSAVVDEVVRHARERPDKTLGVGTFNMPQQQAILDELERRRRHQRDDLLEAFLAKEGPEPFFVKNLETIQGDERDVILLSVTYGPDPAGRVVGNFGPLNRDGGWRRLNVLVTRARERCTVFTSLRAQDIVLSENAPPGVVALKDYLHFAEHGTLAPSAVPAGGFDSPLEEEIANALRQRGWEVHSQIGAAGFWIDLAIVDPRQRGRYLAGIECDGATYHASPTARDRDRLRQDVLEGLGWRILRIWSTDWFKNRERALERLIAGIEEARSGPPPARHTQEPVRRLVRRASRAAEPIAVYGAAPPPRGAGARSREVERYVRREIKARGRDIADTSSAVPALIDLVRVEGPIHVDEAGRVLCRVFGTRLTEANSAALELAIDAAVEAQALERHGTFLRVPGAPVVIRHRGGDCPVTRPELIPPEEYEEAIRLVLKREFGLQPDALHSHVVRTMGFERTGERLKDEVSRAVRRLLESGDATIDRRGYVVVTPQ